MSVIVLILSTSLTYTQVPALTKLLHTAAIQSNYICITCIVRITHVINDFILIRANESSLMHPRHYLSIGHIICNWKFNVVDII